MAPPAPELTPTPTPRPRGPFAPRPLTAEEALVDRLSSLLDPRRLRTGEQTFMLVLAGLVGVYGGLAAGLFASIISLFRIAFFRSDEALAFLRGDPEIWSRFVSVLQGMRWHPELAVLGLVAALAALLYGAVLRRREREDPWAARLMTVAVVGGAGLILFYSLLFFAGLDRTFLRVDGGLLELVQDAPWPLVLVAPALGGLLVGLLIHRYSPESRGHGVAEVMESMAVHNARIPAKTAVFKGLTASLSIASGGSVGREGPIVQIGSAVGSAIGQRLNVSRTQLRTLAGCGAAAGIAASFDAPIAGAMFALEILLADFGVATFSPIVLSSVLATVTSRALLHQAAVASGDVATSVAPMATAHHREIVQLGYRLVSPYEIGPYLVLGVLCGIIALAFIASLDRMEGLFAGKWGGPVGARLRQLPPWAKPAIGGLFLGMVGLFVPHVLGTGYETMNAVLQENLGVWLVLAILLAKIVATSLTLGSGASGGAFFPAIFLGAMAGSVFGSVVNRILPDITASSGAYALVGMGALVAGATQGPLTGMIMMFELTGDYQIILPLMVACLAASLLVNRWLGHSMYTLSLAQRGINPRAGRELALLRGVPVRVALSGKVSPIAADTPLSKVIERITAAPDRGHPVVDAEGRYIGMLSVHDLRTVLFDDDLAEEVVAAGLARNIPPVAEDEDLQTALERITTLDVDHLPVVSERHPGKVVGCISRRDLLLAYQQSDGAQTSR